MLSKLTDIGVLVESNDNSLQNILGDEFITIVGYKFNTRRSRYCIHKCPNGDKISTVYQIPRYLAQECKIPFKSKWSYKSIRGEFIANLYDYQNVCVSEIGRMFKMYNGVCFELEAGLGKSYVAGKVIHCCGVKTLYVTPTKYLMQQAVNDLRGMLKGYSIDYYCGSHKGDADIVVMVINSLCNIRDLNYLSQFGLSIYDECQLYTTEKRITAIERAATKYTLGISAEVPDDDVGVLLQYRLGKKVIADELNGFFIDDELKYNTDLRIIKYAGPSAFSQNLVNSITGTLQTAYMTAQAMCDVYRIQLIVDETRKLYDMGRNIFIWVDSRIAVDLIKKMISMENMLVECPEDVSHLRGGVSEREIELAKNSRIIVATYQYAYVGVSLPKFDAMIMASPRKAKIYQTMKRIYRMGGDPSVTRIVIDIVDYKTGLARQLPSRMEVYCRDVFSSNISKRIVGWRDIIVDVERSTLHSNTICDILRNKIASSDVEQSKVVYRDLLNKLVQN